MAFQIDWNMISKRFYYSHPPAPDTRESRGFRASSLGIKPFKWIRSMVLFCGLTDDYHFRNKTRTREDGRDWKRNTFLPSSGIGARYFRKIYTIHLLKSTLRFLNIRSRICRKFVIESFSFRECWENKQERLIRKLFHDRYNHPWWNVDSTRRQVYLTRFAPPFQHNKSWSTC